MLIETADSTDRSRLVRGLTDAQLPGIREVVPASRTVLLVLHDEAAPSAVIRAVERLSSTLTEVESPSTATQFVTIEVTYDGPDLADVAAHLDLSIEEVISRHTTQTWTCEFVGFLPGFGYLVGEGADLRVPRRAEPRTRIPAGSVALAAGWSAVYPSGSPGGWQLIGRTDAVMFDVSRASPALLHPDTRVRFVAKGVA